jgi:DNA-binding MarR family transcriptional regulator
MVTANAMPATESDDSVGRRYVLEEQIGFLLRVATQRHNAIFAASMVEALTPPQFAAMAKLLELGVCSQNELGRLITLDAATIKGIVDRLRVRGFVAVRPSRDDRRRREITLTERGRHVAQRATAMAAEITEATLAPLRPAERRTLLALMQRLG